jgi:hypothetical protein
MLARSIAAFTYILQRGRTSILFISTVKEIP